MWVNREHYNTLVANVEKERALRQHIERVAAGLEKMLESTLRTHDKLVSESLKNHDDATLLRQQVQTTEHQLTVARANFDWLAAHVNHLEDERAQLLHQRAGINPIVPTIGATPPPTKDIFGVPLPSAEGPDNTDALVRDMNAAMGGFEDVGDKVAEEMGITHDPAGNVKFTK